MNPERERRSSKPGGQSEGTVGRKRRTAAASEDPERQDSESIEQELAELRRLRQSLLQVAQEIFATLGIDPAEGPRFGPGARGMGRPGMMGRRMWGGGASWDAPGPMRRIRPGGRRFPGMEERLGPGGRGPAPSDEDEDTDN